MGGKGVVLRCCFYTTTAWQISLGGNPFFELLELLIGIDFNYGDPSFAIKVTFQIGMFWYDRFETRNYKRCVILLKKSGVHQLRLVVYPIIYIVFLHPQVVASRISEPSTAESFMLFQLTPFRFVDMEAWGYALP